MKKIKLIIAALILTMLLSFNMVYASVTVTEENLREAFQSFTNSEDNKGNYEITLENNIMNIKANGENYQLEYDLTDNPTFSLSVSVNNNMEYAEFKDKLDRLILPLFGYVGVAKVNGIEEKDSMIYWFLSYMSKADYSSINEKNIIYDDTVSDADLVIDNSSNNIIYASQFKGKAMQYINNCYKDVQIISDNDTLNTYELKIEKKNVTESSCDLVSTLTIDKNAYFTPLNGYSNVVDSTDDQLANIFSQDIEPKNTDTQNIDPKNTDTQNIDPENTDTEIIDNNGKIITYDEDDTTKEDSKLPQTGIGTFIVITTISSIVIFIVLMKIKSNKLKDIK